MRIKSARPVKRNTSTSYKRKIEVERLVDGIPVKLALQERTSDNDNAAWWTLSWRTQYRAGRANRRFYLAGNTYWTIPAKAALEMLDEMESKGGLSTQYEDQRKPNRVSAVISTELSPTEMGEAFRRITGPEEDWGDDPFFVICSDPNEKWKKLFILNPDTGLVTFRSITTDKNYMPKKVLRPREGWWLDNSMMDANIQQMRVMKKLLATARR